MSIKCAKTRWQIFDIYNSTESSNLKSHFMPASLSLVGPLLYHPVMGTQKQEIRWRDNILQRIYTPPALTKLQSLKLTKHSGMYVLYRGWFLSSNRSTIERANDIVPVVRSTASGDTTTDI